MNAKSVVAFKIKISRVHSMKVLSLIVPDQQLIIDGKIFLNLAINSIMELKDMVLDREQDSYQPIQYSASPLRKEAEENLLKKPRSKSSFEIQYQPKGQNRKSPQKFASEFDSSGEESAVTTHFFPRFLSWLGRCCTPCRILCPCCFCPCCYCQNAPIFKQQTKSLGLLQQWGRFDRVLQPGLHIINPISQSIVEINMQTKIVQFSQICISKDNVQFNASVVLFYRVVDSYKVAYLLGNGRIEEGVKEIAIGLVRSVVGQNNLQVVIQNRSVVTHKLTEELNRIVDYWGIFVEVSSLKQIIIHQDIQNALQAVTETRRRSEAMIINYKAQAQCAALYKQISNIINTKAAFQIRFLNMVETIANNGQQNVIFVKTMLTDKQNSEERQPLAAYE